MDIALKLKRAVATLAAGALFASSAGVAIAQTFNDVPTDAWYYDYVEQLVDDGVIDAADNYRPADALNRAELVKIAITAIDGLAGYEAPATPTFDDVPADAWFFDYVEAAVQLGIVNGYTDASGNLTGFFGPGDTVNRAAATKILVNAFSVPTDLEPGSMFPDVKSGDWFYDYVVTAYNQSILDGYDNGYFGPADPVTRAQVAKLVVNAQSPVERTSTPDEEDDTPDTPSTSDGDLEVSLNDDTAASSTIPKAATNVALAAFDITADQDDVSVTNLVVTRGGVGNASDWANLYLYEGTKRLTSGRTINSDSNTATFPLSVVVEAGETTTLTLVGDMDGSANASNQHYFYVASAADVTSNAQSVAGDFPVAGNTFTTGNVSVDTVTVSSGTAISKPKIGESGAEVSVFKLQAGSANDIALHQITLTQGGSLSSSKMVNLVLLRGTDEVATADGFDGDRVTFVLDSPFVIPEGQTKTFYVQADIDGGRTTDTVQIYLDETNDVVAIDQQYGYGAVVAQAATPNGLTTTDVALTNLEGGAVTLTDNGPAATQVASNSTNIELLNYSIIADRDLSVRNTDVKVDLKAASTAPGYTGTAIPNTVGTITQGGSCTNTSAYHVGLAGAAPTGLTTADMVLVGTAGYGYLTQAPGTGTATAATATDYPDANGIDLTADATGSASNGITLTITDTATDCVAETAATLAALITGTSPNFVLNCDIDDSGDSNNNPLTGTLLAAAIQNGTTTTIDDAVNAAASGTGASAITAGAITLAGGTDAVPYICVASDINLATIATGSTVVEKNPYSYVKNLKIVNLDTEGTLAGPLTLVSDGAAAAYKQFTEDYNLTGGDALHLSVQADTDINLPAGYEVTASVSYTESTNYFKDDGSNEYVKNTDIVGSALTGNAMTVASNTLVVDRASSPTSDQYVKGQEGVPGLGISLKAGDAGDITIKKLYVRAYADTAGGTWAPVTGDKSAKDMVLSVSLYDGNDLIAGPESLDLVDVSTTAGEWNSGDYYRALFDDLDYVISAGSTETLNVKANLRNTSAGFVSFDLVPNSDIVAEDKDDNSVTLASGALNGTATKTPELTVINNGTLTAYSESNPAETILLAGSTQQHVARYRFHTVDEAFDVQKFTIMLDQTGAFDGTAVTGDYSSSTIASNGIIVTYPDVNGVEKTVTASLGTGTITVSTPGFVVDTASYGDSYVNVYVDVSSAAISSLSGKKLRLGIQGSGTAGAGTNNSSTFKAVGVASSETVVDPAISDGSLVNSFTVRRSKPTFTVDSITTSEPSNGATNDVFKFTVSNEGTAPVGLGRVTLAASATGLDLHTISIQEIVGGVASDLDVSQAGGDITAWWASADVTATGATGLAGNGSFDSDNLILSWPVANTITGGSSKTYLIRGVLANVASSESLTIGFNRDDENTVVSGGTITGKSASNKRVFDSTGVTEGLFTADTTDFGQLLGSARSVIWSDKSDNDSAHPEVAGATGSVTDGSGSSDWTNGYKLGLPTDQSSRSKN